MTPMTNKEAILPCPFCGGTEAFVERKDYSSSYVQCDSNVGQGCVCTARGPIAVQDDDGEETPGAAGAIAAWNRRAIPAQEDAQAVAWAAFAANGNIRLWTKSPVEAKEHAIEIGAELVPLYLHPPTVAASPSVQGESIDSDSISDDRGFPSVLGELLGHVVAGRDPLKFSRPLEQYIDAWHRARLARTAAPSVVGLIEKHGSVLAAANEQARLGQSVSDDPMAWPIPCDVKIGAGTNKKGSSFGALVARMNVLHGMAMKATAPSEALSDAALDILKEAIEKQVSGLEAEIKSWFPAAPSDARKSISDDERFLTLFDDYVALVVHGPSNVAQRIEERRNLFAYIDGHLAPPASQRDFTTYTDEQVQDANRAGEEDRAAAKEQDTEAFKAHETINTLRDDNRELRRELEKQREAIEALEGMDEPAAPSESELHFNAQRLRNVAALVGVTAEGTDKQVDDVRGALLGQIAFQLRKRAASEGLAIPAKQWGAQGRELRESAQSMRLALETALPDAEGEFKRFVRWTETMLACGALSPRDAWMARAALPPATEQAKPSNAQERIDAAYAYLMDRKHDRMVNVTRLEDWLFGEDVPLASVFPECDAEQAKPGLTDQYLAAMSNGGIDGMYSWESSEGSQHDTGRVYFKNPENQHSSFFASTASPTNAKKIAMELNRAILAAQPVPQASGELDALAAAARDVLAERHRQIHVEGWTPEHDDNEHADTSTLATAAVCYIWPTATTQGIIKAPWPGIGFKHENRRNLVCAAALLLAEIERLDRAATTSKTTGEKS